MKNQNLLLLLLILLSTNSIGQSVLDDAITLKNEGLQDSTLIINTKTAPILKKYSKSSGSDNSFDDLAAAYNDNPFLSKDNSAHIKVSPSSSGGNIPASTGKISAPFSATANLSQSAIIDGIAIFLVDRLKQELSLAFFDRFEVFMTDSEFGQYTQTLFPVTHRALATVGNEIYNFDNYINTLRDAFLQDLRNLPIQTIQFLNQFDLIKDPEVKLFLYSGFLLIQDILNGEVKPLQFIEQLTESLQGQNSTYVDYLKFTHLMFSAFSDDKGISKLSNINQLLNPNTLHLFLGLLYQKADKDGCEFCKQTLENLDNDALANTLFNYAIDINSRVNRIKNVLKEMKSDSATPQSIIRNQQEVMSEVINILDNTLSFFPEAASNDIDIVEKSVALLRNLVAFQTNIRLKKFGIAINNIVALLDNLELFTNCEENKLSIDNLKERLDIVINYSTQQQKREHRNAIEAATDSIANYSEAGLKKSKINAKLHKIQDQIIALEKTITGKAQSKKTFCNWLDMLLRYGSFVAAIAEAKSSEDVAKVIDNFALPPGSSRIKKYSSFSVSLNSFVGAGFMAEQTLSNQLPLEGAIAWHAPIGIAANIGFGKKGALSFYATVLDLGAVVSYRVTNNSQMPAPIQQVDFAHILAPGFFIYYGFGCDLPLAIGIGGQYGPLLTSIGSGGVPAFNEQKFRFGISLTVDIPVTHFYTSSKKPKRHKKSK